MTSLKQTLIGELIGLARATDGNEHLITANSTSVILECFHANPDSEQTLQLLLSRVEAAKRKMVPDCFLCANPCGRTSAYELKELQYASEDIRSAKQQILKALENADESTNVASIYRGLIAIGMDELTPDFLISLAREIEG